MSRPVHYIARQQAQHLVGQLYFELPTGTDTDDLQLSVELFLTGFVSECRQRGLTGLLMLRQLRLHSRSIYFGHFWHLGHTLLDQVRQRRLIEMALLETIGKPPETTFLTGVWDGLRLLTVLRINRFRN